MWTVLLFGEQWNERVLSFYIRLGCGSAGPDLNDYWVLAHVVSPLCFPCVLHFWHPRRDHVIREDLVIDGLKCEFYGHADWPALFVLRFKYIGCVRCSKHGRRCFSHWRNNAKVTLCAFTLILLCKCRCRL